MRAIIFAAAVSVLTLQSSTQAPLNLPTSTYSLPMTANERAKVDLALDWWRIVIDAGHLEDVPKFQAESYIQHNPNISTGRAAFLTAFSDGNKPTNPIPAKLEHPPVIAAGRGDFVWFLWEGLRPKSSKNPEAYFANGF